MIGYKASFGLELAEKGARTNRLTLGITYFEIGLFL
jgi:hypothetical protein